MSLYVYTLEMCMFAGPSPPLAEAPPAWKHLCFKVLTPFHNSVAPLKRCLQNGPSKGKTRHFQWAVLHGSLSFPLTLSHWAFLMFTSLWTSALKMKGVWGSLGGEKLCHLNPKGNIGFLLGALAEALSRKARGQRRPESLGHGFWRHLECWPDKRDRQAALWGSPENFWAHVSLCGCPRQPLALSCCHPIGWQELKL